VRAEAWSSPLMGLTCLAAWRTTQAPEEKGSPWMGSVPVGKSPPQSGLLVLMMTFPAASPMSPCGHVKASGPAFTHTCSWYAVDASRGKEGWWDTEGILCAKSHGFKDALFRDWASLSPWCSDLIEAMINARPLSGYWNFCCSMV